jgi:putative transposase
MLRRLRSKRNGSLILRRYQRVEGKLYLCVVIDLFNKRIVGWLMNHRQIRPMLISALQMAVEQRQNTDPVIVPSDRGG